MSTEWAYEFFKSLASKRVRAEAAQAEAEAQRWRSVGLVGAMKSGWRSDHTANDAISSARAKDKATRARREYDAAASRADGYLAELREANPTNGSMWAEALRMRYLAGLRWDVIARRMGVSERTAYLWHRTALDWLDGNVAPGL